MEGHRKVTLDDQMSVVESRREALAGLTLDDVLLGNTKRPTTATFTAPPIQPIPRTRTLLEIIKEDETNKKDRRSWKAFKDKLRLKRAGSAWTSSIPIPTSDIPLPNRYTQNFTHPFRFQTHSNSPIPTHYMSHNLDNLDPPEDSARGHFTRRGSTRYASHSDNPFTAGDPADTVAAGGGLRPSLSRRNSTNMQSEPYRRGRVVTFRDSFDDDDEGGGHPEAVRTMSAREAVAAQEAAEAEEAEKGGGGMMSLMDLLEETDREMGLEGSRYILSDDDDDDDEDDYDDEVDEEEGGKEGEGGVVGGIGGDEEYTCCVCKVRHKGNAFVSCGHTFCRMCSRDLNVGKGNCPLCNNFILEILDIF